MNKVKSRVGAAAAVLGLCGVTTALAAPASAAGNSVYYASNNNGSLAIFKSNDEIVCAKDTKTNNYGAFAAADYYSHGEWLRYTNVYEGRGNGYTTCHDGDPGDIPEGASIRVRACLHDGAPTMTNYHPVYCGPWQYGTA